MNPITHEYTPNQSLTSLSIDGNIEVILKRGSQPYITLEAHDADTMAQIECHISERSMHMSAWTIEQTHPHQQISNYIRVGDAHIQIPKLDNAAAVHLARLIVVQPEFPNIKLQGNVDLEAEDMRQRQWSLTVTDQCSACVEGQVEQLHVLAQNKGQAFLEALRSKSAHLQARGEATIQAKVSHAAEAQSGEDSQICIAGCPTRRSTSLAGRGHVLTV